MLRYFYYILIAALLCSCAAEKRLAHLLAMHPELQHTDTLYKDRIIHLPAEQNSITFTLDELKQIDRQATNTSISQEEDKTPDIQVSTPRSQASIQAHGNGILTLNSTAPPDTIHLIDTVYQPYFVTHTQYKDRIVHELNSFQSFLCYTGVAALLYLLFKTIINTLHTLRR